MRKSIIPATSGYSLPQFEHENPFSEEGAASPRLNAVNVPLQSGQQYKDSIFADIFVLIWLPVRLKYALDASEHLPEAKIGWKPGLFEVIDPLLSQII